MATLNKVARQRGVIMGGKEAPSNGLRSLLISPKNSKQLVIEGWLVCATCRSYFGHLCGILFKATIKAKSGYKPL